jgi:hypothetical protein
MKRKEIQDMKDKGKMLDNSVEMQLKDQELEQLMNILYVRQLRNYNQKNNAEGDRPTKYFLGSGKTAKGRFHIHKIITRDVVLKGDEATTPMENKLKHMLGQCLHCK